MEQYLKVCKNEQNKTWQKQNKQTKKKQDETNEAKNKSKKSSNFITIAIAHVYLETLCFNLYTIPLTTGKKNQYGSLWNGYRNKT